VDRFKGRNGHPVHDVVFLQAPTGTGKTLIGEMVRRKMQERAIYACTTKSLQDQVVRDFTYARVLKGRRNYPTVLGLVDESGNPVDGFSDECVTAADCTSAHIDDECQWCGDDKAGCPYLRARGRAVSADLAILNTAYLVTDAMGPRRFTHRGLTILDECDKLEDELLNHAELHITKGRMVKLGLAPPRYKTKDDTWADWLNEEVIPKAIKYGKDYHTEHSDMVDTRQGIREMKFMEQFMDKVYRVARDLQDGKWVYDGYNDTGYHDVIFRPVYIASYGEPLLWQNGRKFLLMSATVLSDTVMASELGMQLTKDRQYGTVDIPSEFPIENRPIHVVPIADMSFDHIDSSKPFMARAIQGVLKRHPDERILVHCVSYDLAKYLHRHMGTNTRTLITYGSSREKEAALDRYKRTDSAVLFAPSMDRGVDLPDDLCRVQVIAKIPYPNLADKRIKARLYTPGGQAWYTMHTVRTIVQMAGRAVRHREDYAITYMFDKQFEKIWGSNSKMFPRYFRDALNFRFNPRLVTEA
jgi:Rad3-related DNA helicase